MSTDLTNELIKENALMKKGEKTSERKRNGKHHRSDGQTEIK